MSLFSKKCLCVLLQQQTGNKKSPTGVASADGCLSKIMKVNSQKKDVDKDLLLQAVSAQQQQEQKRCQPLSNWLLRTEVMPARGRPHVFKNASPCVLLSEDELFKKPTLVAHEEINYQGYFKAVEALGFAKLSSKSELLRELFGVIDEYIFGNTLPNKKCLVSLEGKTQILEEKPGASVVMGQGGSTEGLLYGYIGVHVTSTDRGHLIEKMIMALSDIILDLYRLRVPYPAIWSAYCFMCKDKVENLSARSKEWPRGCDYCLTSTCDSLFGIHCLRYNAKELIRVG